MSGYYDNQHYSQGYSQPSSYPSGGYAAQGQQDWNNGYNTYGQNPSYYQEQPRYYNQYDQMTSQQPQYGPDGQPIEGDRGLLGAVGGGAAGAYGGHKVGHGFLGAVGGAILGSLTEDFAKDKHKKHKKNGRRGANSSVGGSQIGSAASSFFNQKR